MVETSLGLDGIAYRDGLLHVDAVPVTAIAEAVGTPTYVYSASGIRAAYRRIERAFAPLKARIHYAVKACANLHVCRLLRGLGAGMDVVSGGEMERAWLAGTPMRDIVFAGVGKTDAELRAALDGRWSPLAGVAGVGDTGTRGPVGQLNVESESELERLASIAEALGTRARVCVRVNPDVDPHTHEYTTTGKEVNKFGIDAHRVPALFAKFAGRPGVELVGLHVHIGSPVRRIDPYVASVRVLLDLMTTLERQGQPVTVLDLGGGWAVDYTDGEAPGVEAYARALEPLLAERIARGLRVLLEPGRSIVANAGVLLTTVQHVKTGHKRFVICDAGMHTLIRPALYQAFHFVWPARVAARHLPPARSETIDLPDLEPCDVVGPICESADFLARNRELPPVRAGELLAVFSAGAYGMSMASNYNDHGRPAEVLVDGDRARVVNERQPLDAILATERDARELELDGATSAVAAGRAGAG